MTTSASDPEFRKRRARYAIESRWRPDAPETKAAGKAIAVASLAAQIRRVVSSAPPLTADQRRILLAELGADSPRPDRSRSRS